MALLGFKFSGFCKKDSPENMDIVKMYPSTIMLLTGCFALVRSQFTNIYPSIVQLVAEGSPNQVFKNTAGTSNLFYAAAVSANEGRDNENGEFALWITKFRS